MRQDSCSGLSKARSNGRNSRFSQSDRPKVAVGGMGGALTSAGDGWGKGVGEGTPRCAWGGIQVKLGSSLQGGCGPREGAPHCHVRACGGTEELSGRKGLEEKRGGKGPSWVPSDRPLFSKT